MELEKLSQAKAEMKNILFMATLASYTFYMLQFRVFMCYQDFSFEGWWFCCKIFFRQYLLSTDSRLLTCKYRLGWLDSEILKIAPTPSFPKLGTLLQEYGIGAPNATFHNLPRHCKKGFPWETSEGYTLPSRQDIIMMTRHTSISGVVYVPTRYTLTNTYLHNKYKWAKKDHTL